VLIYTPKKIHAFMIILVFTLLLSALYFLSGCPKKECVGCPRVQTKCICLSSFCAAARFTKTEKNVWESDEEIFFFRVNTICCNIEISP